MREPRNLILVLCLICFGLSAAFSCAAIAQPALGSFGGAFGAFGALLAFLDYLNSTRSRL